MPIYEYKCDNGHVFDIMQRMSDDSLTKCVECDASVRKIMHPVSISFKGSGFYSTDYSGKSKTDAVAKSESPDSATKTDASSSNGDSKNGSDNSSKESKKPDSSSTSSSSSSKKD